MATINGKRFTQLKNLNVLGDFLVRGTALGQPLLSGQSAAASQQPSAVDTPLQIEFGPAQDNDYFTLAADGTLTVKRNGFYLFDVTLRTGRDTMAGASYLFARYTVNGTQAGPSAATTLSENRTRIPLQFVVVAQLAAGDIVKAEVYRDSDGTDNGGLFARSSGIGWNDAPTASLMIYKFE